MIFNWHQVAPLFIPGIHHPYTWTSLDVFSSCIDHLTARFKIMPLHEGLKLIGSGKLRGRCVSLTFDDGDASIADYVEPLLRLRGLPATFFINSAYLDDGRSYWFPILSYLSENDSGSMTLSAELRNKASRLRHTKDPAFYNDVRMRIEQLSSRVPHLSTRLITHGWLSKLDGEQFALGLHGHEHQRFSMMTEEWQRKDLRTNREILCQYRAYRPVFAVPFGRLPDWSPATLTIAREFGLEVVLADGGLNLRSASYYQRQPADSLHARALLARAIQSI